MSAPAIRTLTPRQVAMKLTLKQVNQPWAIYIRVSTKDQGEKYSPASQREALLRLASDIGVYVPENYIMLDMKSGKTDDRPDYQRLLALAADKAIGGALALELSRVARNVTGAIDFRQKLKREGAALVFALQQFDDSPQGRMMYTQFAAFAEYEGELILQRTCKGRLRKAKEGKINDPHAFGYKYHPVVRMPGGKFGGGYVEPDPVEGPNVKRIFEDYAKNGSAFGVQKRLNAAGILTKRGNPWSFPSVLRVLRNRIYTGDYVTTVKGEDFVAEKVSIETPALISKALFDKVQVMLASHPERAGRPPSKHLLSGLIQCTCTLPTGDRCKRRWTVRAKGRYNCSNVFDHRTQLRLCPSRQLMTAMFDSLVLEGVRDHLRNPENTYRMAKAYHIANTRKPEGVSIETRLARLKERYERTETIVFANVPQRTRDKAAAQLLEMEREQRALEVEAREAAVVALPSQDRVVDTCAKICKGLDGVKTFEEKREFLLTSVDRIETDGREYAIYCRIKLAAAGASSRDGRNGQLGHGPVDYFAFVIRGRVA